MLHMNAYVVLSAVESEREETHQLFLENNESIQVIFTKHPTFSVSMGISAGHQTKYLSKYSYNDFLGYDYCL